MTNDRLIAWLVVLYWIIGTLDVASSLWLVDELPAPLLAWLASESEVAGPVEWLTRVWMLVLLAALIAGSLGVLRMENWGRWLFASANAAMFASYPLLDAMVYTWFGGLFADLSLVLTGAILLACFHPASAARFTPDRRAGGEQQGARGGLRNG
jgi:hypothetical protein